MSRKDYDIRSINKNTNTSHVQIQDAEGVTLDMEFITETSRLNHNTGTDQLDPSTELVFSPPLTCVSDDDITKTIDAMLTVIVHQCDTVPEFSKELMRVLSKHASNIHNTIQHSINNLGK